MTQCFPQQLYIHPQRILVFLNLFGVITNSFVVFSGSNKIL